MIAKLKAPGWYRAALFTFLGVAFATALDVVIRTAYGNDDVFVIESCVVISMIAAPLFFLVGLGAFDYWFYWAPAKPTRAEDHSSPGALSWKDSFRVNTDHKVIAIQYTGTAFFFMFT